VVGERDGGHVVADGVLDHIFETGRAAEEREFGVVVQVYKRGGHNVDCPTLRSLINLCELIALYVVSKTAIGATRL
jgi:hypothetical protein